MNIPWLFFFSHLSLVSVMLPPSTGNQLEPPDHQLTIPRPSGHPCLGKKGVHKSYTNGLAKGNNYRKPMKTPLISILYIYICMYIYIYFMGKSDWLPVSIFPKKTNPWILGFAPFHPGAWLEAPLRPASPSTWRFQLVMVESIPWRIRLYGIYGLPFTINIPQSC